jgi:hypothetical protein
MKKPAQAGFFTSKTPRSFTDKTTQFLLSDKSLAVIDQKQEL